MSAMAYREPNEVMWRGCRPGHKGTQVAVSGTANNATTILRTVTAGKTLFLVAATINIYATAAGIGARIKVRDTADVDQYIILPCGTANGSFNNEALSLCYPIEIPAGYDVCLVSDAATAFASGFIFGWEE